MTVTYLQITGLDPIVARDGRPFGDGTGNRMRGLPWPLPSAVAGSARRAFVIQQDGRTFDDNTIDELLAIEVAGLFPVVDDKTMYLPAPKNCVWQLDKKANIDRVYRSVPMELPNGEGCDLADGLRPVMLENPPADDFKPEPLPAWWPVDELAKWLIGEPIPCGANYFGNGQFLSAARSDLRERVCIDPATGAAEESKLFAVSDLTISHLARFVLDKNEDHKLQRIRLSCRVSVNELTSNLDILHPLGGNRRLAHWKTEASIEGLWKCPPTLATKLSSAQRVCLMLATPALFANGYLPGWLHDNVGTPPGASGVQLKLAGVVSGRWNALARFALDPRNRGPRPIRRMVPAGSMYFFEVQEGDAAQLADRWLKSVSDGEQDQRDGFGLAVWGTW